MRQLKGRAGFSAWLAASALTVTSSFAACQGDAFTLAPPAAVVTGGTGGTGGSGGSGVSGGSGGSPAPCTKEALVVAVSVPSEPSLAGACRYETLGEALGAVQGGITKRVVVASDQTLTEPVAVPENVGPSRLMRPRMVGSTTMGLTVVLTNNMAKFYGQLP